MAKKASNNGEIELPVRYGNVSIGEDTCRLGIAISRGNLTPSKADSLLCGRRLTCSLFCAPKGADPDQPSLPNVEVGREVEAVVDVKSFGVKRKAITAGLTFNLEDVDLDSLVHFAKRDGRITVRNIENLDDLDAAEQSDPD